MASRAGHCEVAQFLLQNAAQVDAKAKVQPVQSYCSHHQNKFTVSMFAS